MKRKRAEESLGKMMRFYGFRADKGRDRGYLSCPNCHKALMKCPYCKSDMLLPKAKTRLDYTVMFKWTEVECKQGEETWALNDFTDTQEEIISNIGMRGVAWLFLEIGNGRAPSGKEAYLIDIADFKEIREKEYEGERKSIRFRATDRSRVHEARELFPNWMLKWKTGEGWTIPDDHPFWLNDLDSDIEKIQDMARIMVTNDKQDKSTPAPTRLSMLG